MKKKLKLIFLLISISTFVKYTEAMEEKKDASFLWLMRLSPVELDKCLPPIAETTDAPAKLWLLELKTGLDQYLQKMGHVQEAQNGLIRRLTNRWKKRASQVRQAKEQQAELATNVLVAPQLLDNQESDQSPKPTQKKRKRKKRGKAPAHQVEQEKDEFDDPEVQKMIAINLKERFEQRKAQTEKLVSHLEALSLNQLEAFALRVATDNQSTYAEQKKAKKREKLRREIAQKRRSRISSRARKKILLQEDGSSESESDDVSDIGGTLLAIDLEQSRRDVILGQIKVTNPESDIDHFRLFLEKSNKTPQELRTVDAIPYEEIDLMYDGPLFSDEKENIYLPNAEGALEHLLYIEPHFKDEPKISTSIFPLATKVRGRTTKCIVYNFEEIDRRKILQAAQKGNKLNVPIEEGQHIAFDLTENSVYKMPDGTTYLIAAQGPARLIRNMRIVFED